MKTVVVDVDEVVIDLHEEWTRWSLDRNLIIDFSIDISDDRLLDFWRDDKLYDDKRPTLNVPGIINRLKEKFKIIFVSHCFEEHIESKKKFLKKHFGDCEFVNTGDKHLVKCDFIIDDREKYLQPGYNRKTILLRNKYHPSTGVADYEANDWYEIEKILIN